MDVSERFQHSYQTLEHLRAELLDAREAARNAPEQWGGWSVRFNQRLRGDRLRLAILLPPPESADPRLRALYDAATAIRALWDTMNLAVAGRPADVAAARVGMERAMHRAREALERQREG